MLQIGNRIYFNQNGKVTHQTGERQGDVLLNVENEVIQYIDLPFGDKTLENVQEFHIENGQIVVDKRFEITLSAEQQQIIDLENQMLLMADSQTGGIL